MDDKPKLVSRVNLADYERMLDVGEISKSMQRRPGLEFVTALPGPAVRLELVNSGNWSFIKAHMENGEIMLFGHDGKPVVIQGGKQG